MYDTVSANSLNRWSQGIGDRKITTLTVGCNLRNFNDILATQVTPAWREVVGKIRYHP